MGVLDGSRCSDEGHHGEPLSDFVLRSGLSEREINAAEEKLEQTEYTQPAMLTADLAMERLLNQHGIHPDMVAGHSPGEYAALMVSGILDLKTHSEPRQHE